jgi:hypothetical protein
MVVLSVCILLVGARLLGFGDAETVGDFRRALGGLKGITEQQLEERCGLESESDEPLWP